MGFYEFPANSLVVVSSPKDIKAEWRFVVVEDQVVAGSQYKDGQQLGYQVQNDPAAFELAQTVATHGYRPDPVWIADICQTADGGYHLLEIGGFSFSNLYACDKDAIVAAVSQAAISAWNDGQAEQASSLP